MNILFSLRPRLCFALMTNLSFEGIRVAFFRVSSAGGDVSCLNLEHPGSKTEFVFLFSLQLVRTSMTLVCCKDASMILITSMQVQ